MRKAGKKIHVMYLIGQLGLGGSERQLYTILRASDYTEFEYSVIVFNPSDYVVLDDKLRELRIRVLSIPESKRGILQRSRYLFRLMRTLRPDVIHSWTVHDNPYAGVIGRFAMVPVRLGSLRGSMKLRGFQSLPNWQQWLCIHSVQELVVNAAYLADELFLRGIATEQVKVIRNGVEHAGFQDTGTRSSVGFPLGKQIITTVGNLRSVKNHLLFIEALALVKKDFLPFQAVIVGQPLPSEPDLPAKLRTRIHELGMEDHIMIMGFREDIPLLLEHSDIFSLMSVMEGTPNVILEAMLARLPVVATRVGGIPDIVQDGITGYLVDSGDAGQFAFRLLELLQNPEKGQRMGSVGREYVLREHSARHIGQEFQKYYQSKHP